MTDDPGEWRDAIGFKGLYQVRPPDRIRSVHRGVPQLSRWGTVVVNRHAGRELKPFVTRSGRLRVVLHDSDHQRHSVYVDALVAEAFGAVI